MLREPYNPLDYRNIAESVAAALLREPISPFPPESFLGVGIYAIFYTGSFPAYKIVAKRNLSGKSQLPIYVGKAVSEGARKGIKTGLPSGTKLCGRLREHGRTIELAENLEIADFFCRFLVVDDIWISMSESSLINRFKPLWNVLIDGFGMHPPGTGRPGQRRSAWDTIHPGREFATKLPLNDRTPAEIIDTIVGFLKHPQLPDDYEEGGGH